MRVAPFIFGIRIVENPGEHVISVPNTKIQASISKCYRL